MSDVGSCSCSADRIHSILVPFQSYSFPVHDHIPVSPLPIISPTHPLYPMPAYTRSGAPPPTHGSRPYGRDSRRGGYPDDRRRSPPPRSYDTRPTATDSRDSRDNRVPTAVDDRSPNRDILDRDGRRASRGRSASPRRDSARSARSVSSRRSASPRPVNGHAGHEDERERRDD